MATSDTMSCLSTRELPDRDILIAECTQRVRQEIVGLLLFGSHVCEMADRFSDIDILCVIEDGRSRRHIFSLQQRCVHLEVVTLRSIEMRLANRRSRDHHVLVALLTGSTLIDKYSHLMRIQQRARHLWNSGPSRPTQRERCRLRLMLMLLAHKVDALDARLCEAESREPDVTCKRLHLEDTFLQVHDLWMRVHCLWSVPVWTLNSPFMEAQYKDAAKHFDVFFKARTEPAILAKFIRDIILETQLLLLAKG